MKQRPQTAFPIEWHEQCLRNMRSNYERELHALDERHKEVTQFWDRIKHYGSQIDEAKARGMTQFDRDRFMKQRRAKG